LDELRSRDPSAKLAGVQLGIAREHGFASWRKFKERVEQISGDLPKLFEAIRKDDRPIIRKLLDEKPELAHIADAGGQDALHIAAESNNPDAVDILMGRKADPTTHFRNSGHTALSWALTTQAWDSVKALLRNGVKPDFFCAAGMGDLELVKSFFDEKENLIPNVSQTGSSRWLEDGTTLPSPPIDAREQISDALYFAARNGHVEVVRELLRHDPDVNFRAFMGATPLHWAYFAANREIVNLLLASGADSNLRDWEFRATPRAFGICATSSWWHVGHLLARVLQMDPTIVNIHEGRGTPLHEAARSGNVQSMQILLKVGANPNIRDSEGKTPLDRTIEAKCKDGIALLKPITKGN
jgi:ankyrin repeat protein